MAKETKVKCLVSFFINDAKGKQQLKGKRGEEIEVSFVQAKKLIAAKLAVAAKTAPEPEPSDPAE